MIDQTYRIISKINRQIVITAFAWVGLLVSAYLWYEYAQPHAIGCTLTDCQAVRASAYSKIFGVDMPIFGFFYYLVMVLYLGYLILKKKNFVKNVMERKLFVVYAAIGFVFSMYLTYLEAFVIDAFCQWCLISAFAATMVFLNSFLWYRKFTY